MMTGTTTKGLQLYETLARATGRTNLSGWVCSRICRMATTYGRMQEEACSVEFTDREERRRDRKAETLEASMRELVRMLWADTGEPWTVKFGGDPRGYTVEILIPGTRGNTWGGSSDGYGVPGS